jgi:sigma54-dependent transcription regulator
MLTDSEILRRHQRGQSFRFVPLADWRATLGLRANVMITGPKDALDAFLEAARPELREPIKSADGTLPPLLDGMRTLILTDVDRLDAAEQRRLRHWFEERRNADVQVISLTSIPLFSLVSENAFDTELYYRLNTIFLEVQSI